MRRSFFIFPSGLFGRFHCLSEHSRQCAPGLDFSVRTRMDLLPVRQVFFGKYLTNVTEYAIIVKRRF